MAELQEKLAAFAATEDLKAELVQEGDAFRATVIGKSAHGSTPELGLNAATYLAKFLDQFAFDGAAKVYLDTTANVLHKDFAGENLGVAYTDAKMGALSMNAGVFKFNRNSDDNTITLNFRYPQGTDSQIIKAELEKLNGVTKVTLSDHEHTPHYVPADDHWYQHFFQFTKTNWFERIRTSYRWWYIWSSLNAVLPSVLCSQTT